MKTKRKRFFLVWSFSLLLIFSTAAGLQAYSNILALGDSLSDNGYNGVEGNTDPKDIYGFKHYTNPNPSTSNGLPRVWVEYMATNLGVPLFDMAYGGATTGNDNPAAAAGLNNSYFDTRTGLQWQVSSLLARPDVANYLNGNALVTVWAGGNDMFNYARGTNGYTPASTANFLAGNYNPANAAANIALAIQRLYNNGGRYFAVPNLEIGGAYAAWIAAFDASLAPDLYALMNLNDIHIFYLDMNQLQLQYNVLNETWIQSNSQYPEGTIFRFWDTVGVHPTTEIHQQYATYALSQVPEPISVILLVLGLAGLVGIKRKMKA
jgi:phospholipase/lecithinase/hemolysin